MKVTFCGHSELYRQEESVAAWLNAILPPLIEQGADKFYLGGYGKFDSLAAEAVRRQKRHYPQIEAILVLAYLNHTTDAAGYDRTVYPPLENVPPRYAIIKRNYWMVEAADAIISYVTHDWGGAAKTLAHAKKKQKIIISYPEMPVILTFERVLEVFREFIQTDNTFDVVPTKYGYTILNWERFHKFWDSAIVYPTPESLRDALMEKFSFYWEDALTQCERDLTETEEREIEKRRQTILAQLQTVSSLRAP